MIFNFLRKFLNLKFSNKFLRQLLYEILLTSKCKAANNEIKIT